MGKRRTFSERFADKLEKLKAKREKDEQRERDRIKTSVLTQLEKSNPVIRRILTSTQADVVEVGPCFCGECEDCKKRSAKAKEVVAKPVKLSVKIKHFPVEEDDILREIYKSKYENNAFKTSQKRLPHRTAGEIFRRASELGLIRTRERYRWSDDELMVVETFAHCSLETIQRKLVGVSPKGCKRTRSAIAGQIHALKFRTNLNGMNHSNLADALGVSVYGLHQWRERGYIAGSRLPTIDQHKDRVDFREDAAPWFYHNNDIIVFLLEYPQLYDFRLVNQQWFVDLMASAVTQNDVKLRNRVKTANGTS